MKFTAEDKNGLKLIGKNKNKDKVIFDHFSDDLVICCLNMRYESNYYFKEDANHFEEQIKCDAVLPYQCLGVFLTEDLCNDYEEINLEHAISSYKEKSKKETTLDRNQVFNNISNNDNIRVSINYDKENPNDNRGYLDYKSLLSNFRGRDYLDNYQYDIELHLVISKEIFEDLKEKSLHDKNTGLFLITIKPIILKLQNSKPIETAKENGLFCVKKNNFYFLTFFDKYSRQSCDLIQFRFVSNINELKDDQLIREFGYWSDEGKNLPSIKNIEEQITNLTKKIENLSNFFQKSFDSYQNLKNKKWWF